MANSLYSPHLALPPRVRKHLLIALLMCAPLTIFTPYGWPYLKELVVGQLIGYEGDVNIKDLKIEKSWRKQLEAFERAASGKKAIPESVFRIADGILAETYQDRPPLLSLNEPSVALGQRLNEIINKHQ